MYEKQGMDGIAGNCDGRLRRIARRFEKTVHQFCTEVICQVTIRDLQKRFMGAQRCRALPSVTAPGDQADLEAYPSADPGVVACGWLSAQEAYPSAYQLAAVPE